MPLAHRGRRLVAYLALSGPSPRMVVAETLWPEASEPHALSNLRTGVHEVRTACPGLLDDRRDLLDLSGQVHVDVRVLHAATGLEPPGDEVLDLLTAAGELLPGWYEDWVVFEQERHRAQRVQRLDAAAVAAMEAGSLRRALALADLAVSLDPLRESPLRTLVQVHLLMGNLVEALREYQRFRSRTEREFGIAPSPLLRRIVEPWLAERAARVEAARRVPVLGRVPGVPQQRPAR